MPNRSHEANPFRSGDLFVGRGRDLARVEALLGQGQSVLLIGGRRAGKTTLARKLSADRIKRTLVTTDVSGWDLTGVSSGLGALRAAIEGVSPTTHATAERNDIIRALEAAVPVTLVIDEADRLLLASWGPEFFHFLRWLDDAHLRRRISIMLVGGPVLILFKDPDDKGSPPLNTAEPHYLSPLDPEAVVELAELGAQAALYDEILSLCGGQAWLTTRLLAEMWDGVPLADAIERVSEGSIGTFEVWQRQLGTLGRDLLRRLPADGIPREDFSKAPWARYRGAATFARSIGVVRRVDDRVCHGPHLFQDWFADAVPDERVWDIAISYAHQDDLLAREIYDLLQYEFDVFFAPFQRAPLWGSDLNRSLPNIYGVQSTCVLVLSTQIYVENYWAKAEFDAVAVFSPGRILLLDLGAIPADLPVGLVYLGGSGAEMASLVEALRKKLASRRNGPPHRGLAQVLEPSERTPLPGQPPEHERKSLTRTLSSPAATQGCGNPQATHKGQTPTETSSINATLVTIHGYWSSPTTWERLNDIWRADQELRGLRIHPFGYPSPKRPQLPFSATRVPDYDDIAQTLASEYSTVLDTASDIAFVTHSQGGLILQRFLAWMVNEGRAEELNRIRSIIMLACPNGGSEYLESIRNAIGYSRHPQAGNLHVLNRQVADTQRTVLRRIVHALALDNHQCRIPFHVYAGASDNIVKAASAQSAFPGASTIAGDHSTILDPSTPGNRTGEVIKHHLLIDITARHKQQNATPDTEVIDETENLATDDGIDSAKYVINIRDARGLQIGDHNVQRNVPPEK